MFQNILIVRADDLWFEDFIKRPSMIWQIKKLKNFIGNNYTIHQTKSRWALPFSPANYCWKAEYCLLYLYNLTWAMDPFR